MVFLPGDSCAMFQSFARFATTNGESKGSQCINRCCGLSRQSRYAHGTHNPWLSNVLLARNLNQRLRRSADSDTAHNVASGWGTNTEKKTRMSMTVTC